MKLLFLIGTAAALLVLVTSDNRKPPPLRANNLLGKRVRFETDRRGFFLRHKGRDVVIEEKDEKDKDFRKATIFKVVPGLSGEGISLEADSRSKYFIVQDGTDVFLKRHVDEKGFKRSATWMPRNGLANPHGVSFASVTEPGHFMRHVLRQVKVGEFVDSERFKNDSTFRPVPAIKPPGPPGPPGPPPGPPGPPRPTMTSRPGPPPTSVRRSRTAGPAPTSSARPSPTSGPQFFEYEE
uniref:Alpha-L-arabinofuranosidase B arabinose-binding domain-containing protein n=1 Tax=Amphimedon queenslandica TaxID=400682 RepID=A0A1X7VPY0_AMPQE